MVYRLEKEWRMCYAVTYSLFGAGGYPAAHVAAGSTMPERVLSLLAVVLHGHSHCPPAAAETPNRSAAAAEGARNVGLRAELDLIT